MRIVYLGTPDFSVPPFLAIAKAGYDVVAVITQPDRPVGRKQVLTPPPLKVAAENLGIPVYQFEKIRVDGVETLKSLAPDMMITCAYGQILSEEILRIPTFGTFNLHASLLPYYRGSSPIQWAVYNGETKTGITVMRTDVGVDTGDILRQDELDIMDGETAGELSCRLSNLAASSVLAFLKDFKDGGVVSTPQDHSRATTTKMIKKEDAKLDFSRSAQDLVNAVRAFNPSPVAYFFYNGEPLKVYAAKALSGDFGESGRILINDEKGGLSISCNSGAISLLRVQRAGGKPMEIADFLRGFRLTKDKVDD